MSENNTKPLRVGELAKAVGKSVRALHLYEELGLLKPMTRSAGGFRLYNNEAIDRINWIIKLQAIGFSLTEIRGFIADFESADSGVTATTHVRDVFEAKLGDIREQIAQLQVVENDLVEALEYLESCTSCRPSRATDECGVCGHLGHEPGDAPELFAGLSQHTYDVDAAKLRPASPRGPKDSN